MLPKSIRWRLPLSYASIALIAALALGAVLLTSLRGYYASREQNSLLSNAQLISDMVGRMYDRQRPQDQINTQINALSFVSQARIQLFDAQNKLLADSGNPSEKRVLTFNYDGPPTGADPIYFANGDMPPPPDSGTVAQKFWIVGNTLQGGDITSAFGYASSQAAGVASTNGQESTPTAPLTLPPTDQFTGSVAIRVSGSPYGIDLRRDFSTTSHSDQSVQVPVYNQQHNVLGSVEVSNGPAYGTEIIDGMTAALVGAGTLAVILAAAVGWFMSRTITAPLLLLADATTQMAQGELSTRVSSGRSDEFGDLARAFNEMAQRVEATVVALRRFVADAAHQIHTPLTAVHADLELAASEPDDARRQMFIVRALVQLKRMEALTNDLLDLSRLEAHVVDDRRTVVDLVLMVREISESFASRAEQAGIAFNIETPQETVKAKVNETQFRHAIGNLLDNAIKFTPENGSITVGVRCDDDQVELWVNDTGIGISAEDLPELFNRFHRGRNAAAYPGSGLGLAIIKAIVEGHQGQITVQSGTGHGTHFELHVPAGAS